MFDVLARGRRSLSNPHIMAHVQRVLSFMMAAVTLVSAFFSSYNSAHSDGSSPSVTDAERPGLTELVQPLDTSRVLEDSGIRNDIAAILNESRVNSGRLGLNPDFDLSLRAQRWAERNATTDSFKATPADVVMVQAMMPYDQAKAPAFLDHWFKDQASQAALADRDVTRIGVGVASAQGKTFAVIQLS